jgi:hypothetical protein
VGGAGTQCNTFSQCAAADTNLGPCDTDADNDGLPDRVEAGIWGSDPLNPDSDNDGIGDANESMVGSVCGLGLYGLSRGDGDTTRMGFGDATHPRVSSALNGLLDCDTDQDNDGLADAGESTGADCGGTITQPGGKGDVTIDDNHNGNPATGILTGTDAADDGVPWDTDGDGQIDGYECAQGTNPTLASSKVVSVNVNSAIGCGSPLTSPLVANEWGSGGSPSADLDDDNDGLQNAWERCKWGTSTSTADTDGDGKSDCNEAADIDGSGAVNITDAIIVAKSGQLALANFGKDYTLDFDGNGSINLADAIIVAQAGQNARLRNA